MFLNKKLLNDAVRFLGLTHKLKKYLKEGFDMKSMKNKNVLAIEDIKKLGVAPISGYKRDYLPSENEETKFTNSLSDLLEGNNIKLSSAKETKQQVNTIDMNFFMTPINDNLRSSIAKRKQTYSNEHTTKKDFKFRRRNGL